MANEQKLNKPWLVAVWPGMGHVAVNAGYYLMAKLGMHLVAEFAPRELFDLEHVDVSNGLIRQGRLPRSRFFVGSDPSWKHDIVLYRARVRMAQTPPSLPRWKRAFALRPNSLEACVVQKPKNHRGKLGGVCVNVPRVRYMHSLARRACMEP